MTAQVDHLVVAASTLDEGIAWCERTLGITPGPGGEHPLMGTHNRLFSIATAQHPTAYFEIIAIHSGATCARIQGEKRWFDLENEALQLQLKQNGPQLIHFVASTSQAAPAIQALASLGIDRGELLTASRMTANGLLSWKITVRPDGQRLMQGTLPTLIEWGEVHPTHLMAASGVALHSLTASQPQIDALAAGYKAIGLAGVAVTSGAPNLVAVLETPLGLVRLESAGH
ncbi:MAG: VOC family protein [Polaromonas sp.]|nr:VOC family protein [Polaromonas sp.]